MSSAQRYVPYAFARDNSILLKPQGDREAEVWITESTGLGALNEVIRAFPGRVRPSIVDAKVLAEAIAQTYSRPEDSAEQIVGDIEGEIDITRMMQDVPDIEDLLETEDDAPIIRMINALLTQAARDGASDIHLETFERVRWCVSGSTARCAIWSSRAGRCTPRSSRASRSWPPWTSPRSDCHRTVASRCGSAARAIDVRVSTIPTGYGERVVLRLLDKQASRLDLDASGHVRRARADDLDAADPGQPHGILLVTGPTGSGKTTTLYAAFRRLDYARRSNILTVEDPVEYDLAGRRPDPGQPEDRHDLRPGAARDPAPGPRRHDDRRDPRPGDGADRGPGLAHRPPGAGHAAHQRRASAVTRLIDMGIEPFLLSSSLIGVLAQRLVRKLCPRCKKPDAAGRGFHPVGCELCGHSGYSGRTGIYELLPVDDSIRDLIHAAANDQEIRRTAEAAGMLPLRADAMRWYAAGITSQEEILRVTRD